MEKYKLIKDITIEPLNPADDGKIPNIIIKAGSTWFLDRNYYNEDENSLIRLVNLDKPEEYIDTVLSELNESIGEYFEKVEE